ncbi:MAG: hypothetical protein NTV30_08895 [Chloroflexi bacterium]|nr:hypothetical protein [Chloroflexota bacterium]
MTNYATNQEVREQAGFQYKQRSESLGNGDGSEWIFYVLNKPIVSRSNNGSPIGVYDVVVYVSGSPVGVSAIDGTLGKLTLTATPASGSPITCDYDWSNLDEYVLDEYVAESHDLVNAKVGNVYTLPLSGTSSLLKLIEKKLAAGLLLDKEFSVGGDETEDSRGRRWIKWAEQKLEDISNRELQLLDSNGNLLNMLELNAISGFPDNTTKDLGEDESGGDVKFRISKEF